MHELAVAQGLVMEAERVAAAHRAALVERIVVRVGALSGVEPELLERAFDIARAGTCARNATLEFEQGAIEIRCRSCGSHSVAAAPNRLICGACGGWQVDVTAGEDLLLVRLELSDLGAETEPPQLSEPEARSV